MRSLIAVRFLQKPLAGLLLSVLLFLAFPLVSSGKVFPIGSSGKVFPLVSSGKVFPIGSSGKVFPIGSGGKDTGLLPCDGTSTEEISSREDSVDAVARPSVSAKSAILLNGKTGEVYYTENAEERLPMASTTKIMTALVAIESSDLSMTVEVSPAAVGVEGSSIYLYAGEKLTMQALLYALLLESANDAAVAIACAVAGSIEEFAILMNEKAASLGLEHTHFVNPHGLDDEEHYTTAHDLGLIARAAMQNETFREIVSTYKKTIPMSDTDGVRLFINHNRLLHRYDGCVGIKTGYTKRSGRCLVSAAERDGLLLIAVTLSDPDDWRDHAALFDYGFSLYEEVSLTGTGISCTVPVYNSLTSSLTVSYKGTFSVTLPKGHGEITSVLLLPHYLWEDVETGEEVGRAVFYCDGEEIASLPLTAEEAAEQISYRFHFFKWLSELFQGE